MGFSSLIDILGSALIGGMLFLILLRINDASVENTFVYGGELIIQQNLVSIVQLLEHDFRKIGFCDDWQVIHDPSKSIVSADSSSISFLTDVDIDGVVDTIHYYLGTTSELASTPNPRDRILYRVVNNATPGGANLGVTQFYIRYFDALGDTIPLPVTVPSEIYEMEINIRVENVAAYDTNYSSAFWRQVRLAARNLKNR